RHLPVGLLFDAIVTCAHEPDGDFPHDLAPVDFRFKGLARPLAPEAHLLFRHRALQPQPEAIIELARIIEAVISNEPGLRQRTHIDQMMPGPVVAGQPGGPPHGGGSATHPPPRPPTRRATPPP